MSKNKIVRSLVVSSALALASAGSAVSPAQAATFTNNYDGQDSYTWSGSTTLNYSNGHASFNEKVWTDAGTTQGSRPNWAYSISLYDVRGQLLWNAGNQTTRTYYLGSNVTKVVVTPNTGYVGVAVNWRKA